MEDCQTSIEIPEYQCIKKVRGLKIDHFVRNHNDSVDLFFDDKRFAPMNIESEYLAKKPNPQDGWYYVLYTGGYFSFSPPQEFEDGYSLIS